MSSVDCSCWVGLGRVGLNVLTLFLIIPIPIPTHVPLGFYETDADGVEYVQTEPCKSAKNYLKGT